MAMVLRYAVVATLIRLAVKTKLDSQNLSGAIS